MIEHAQKISELYRRLNNIIRIGKVVAVDYNKAKAQVQIGKIKTAYLPWMVPSTDTWVPLKNGEQVLVLSPNGDTSMGVILPALYQTANPAPGTDKNKILINKDIDQTGNLNTTGTVTADSDITTSGAITASGEIEGNGIKLSAHTHTVQYVGAGQGATPQSATTAKPS